MTEIVAAITILLAPAGIVLGWLCVMAVMVAALAGATSGARLVNPRPDPTIGDRSAASSH